MVTSVTKPKVRKSKLPKSVRRPRGAALGVVERFLTDAIKKGTEQPIPDYELARYIEEGLPYGELTDLLDFLGVSLDRMAGLLRTSKATLQRRKAQGRLTPAESDIVIRYAKLARLATCVCGNKAYGSEWLREPAFGLGFEVPLDFARSEAGANEVASLLLRIEYGVLA